MMSVRSTPCPDPACEFRAALEAAGLTPGEVLPDAVLRRCPTTHHPRSTNGAYKLFEDGRGGWFEDHADGRGVQFWTAAGAEPMTEAERETRRKEIEAARIERERHQAEAQAKATEAARRYFESLDPEPRPTPYTEAKGLPPPPGTRTDGATLVMPIYAPDGQLMNVERIFSDGTKRTLKDGPVSSGFFPLGPKNASLPLLIGEGLCTVFSAHQATGWPGLAARTTGNLLPVGKMARKLYPEREIILLADFDGKTEAERGTNPGMDAAKVVCVAIGARMAAPPAKVGQKIDFDDLRRAEGPEAVKALIEAARPVDPEGRTEAGEAYPDPMALPDGLPPVAAFAFELLPETLRPWAVDISDRMQCCPDYVGAALMACAAALIGRKIGIRPQAATDWTVICNLWALLIGRPGTMKSPPIEEALKPLKHLAALAFDQYQRELAEFEKQKTIQKLRVEAAEKQARKLLKNDPGADVSAVLEVKTQEAPTLRRFITNDCTLASLTETLIENPNGLLIHRDELISLAHSLDREENSEVRGFYITAWNGDSAYTTDRIGRGPYRHVPAACLSILGSTQPARIARYVKGAVDGSGDDGFLQRFGLTVWPDTGATWRDVDRWPDNEAKRTAYKVFERLARLDPATVGAKQDTDPDGNPEGIPYLRFDAAGLDLFRGWRQDLETRLRSGDLHPAFESHLAKYRKLEPGLALICHLADGGNGPVGRVAALRALAWAEYLETHARRLYASVAAPDAATARAIIAKIRSGALSTVLTVRDISRPQWAGLTDLDTIKSGVKLLVARDWLIESRKDTGGRPTFEYRLNPKTEGLR